MAMSSSLAGAGVAGAVGTALAAVLGSGAGLKSALGVPLVGWCNAHDDSLGGGGGALLSHVRVHLAPAGNPGSRSGYDHQKFSSRGAQLPHGCSTSFQSSERNLHAGTREKPFLFFLKKMGRQNLPALS